MPKDFKLDREFEEWIQANVRPHANAVRAINCFMDAGYFDNLEVRNLADFLSKSDRDLLRVRNLGSKTILAIRAAVSAMLRPQWADPTPEMMADPRFEAIWQAIKGWDINVPHAYHGYMGATGNHVRAILDTLDSLAQGVRLNAAAGKV